jgi:hypothetical protein
VLVKDTLPTLPLYKQIAAHDHELMKIIRQKEAQNHVDTSGLVTDRESPTTLAVGAPERILTIASRSAAITVSRHAILCRSFRQIIPCRHPAPDRAGRIFMSPPGLHKSYFSFLCNILTRKSPKIGRFYGIDIA